MNDSNKTKKQLINDLNEMQNKVSKYKTANDNLKDTVKRLKKGANYYKRITDALTDYIFTVFLENGQPIETTHSYNSVIVTGYTPEELATNQDLWIQMVHNDDREAVIKHAQEILCGNAKPMEHRIVRKDGQVRWVRNTPVCHFNSKGNLQSYVGLIHDITDRKRNEELMCIQRDLGIAICVTHGLNETLRMCVETAIRIANMDCGGVYLADEKTGDLELSYHKGLSNDFIKSASVYKANSANAHLVMAGKPVYSKHKKLGVPLNDARSKEGLRAVAVIPVHYQNEVIACLNIAHLIQLMMYRNLHVQRSKQSLLKLE